MKPSPGLAAAAVLSIAFLVAGSFEASARTASRAGDVEQAAQTTTILVDAVVARVVSISDSVPPEASPAAVGAASNAVSLLVPESQSAYRLVDATGAPLDASNVPADPFEVRALIRLLEGAPAVQEVVGAELRTLVPLTSDMHPNCTTCHADYGGLPPGTLVGAASFRVGL